MGYHPISQAPVTLEQLFAPLPLESTMLLLIIASPGLRGIGPSFIEIAVAGLTTLCPSSTSCVTTPLPGIRYSALVP